MSSNLSPTLTVVCPQCGTTLKVPGSLGGKKGRCLKCQGIVSIPMHAAPAPPAAAVATASSFDDDFNDYKLMSEPPPAAAPPMPQINYTNYQPAAQAEKKYDGAFGMEKKAFDSGLLGGLAMMAIAAVWFFVGLAAGYIFFYPPILFIIGIAACIRSAFSRK